MNIKNFNPSTVTIGNTIWMAENLSIDDGEGEVFIRDNEY